MRRTGFLVPTILFILFILSKFNTAALELIETGFRWRKCSCKRRVSRSALRYLVPAHERTRMFCSECGSPAAGNFCSNCGSPLQKVAAVAKMSDQDEPLVAALGDWEDEVSYEHLVRLPAVRAALSRHVAQARTGLTCEKFLEICDQVIPGQVSYAGVAAVAQPLWASLGVRTGKEDRRKVAVPIGRAIARTLCSLARHGQKIQDVEQAADGCTITAELPSSLFAMKGQLRISLRRDGRGTDITAATHIPGQAFDWGKSGRCLQTLWGDLGSEMGLPPAGRSAHAA